MPAEKAQSTELHKQCASEKHVLCPGLSGEREKKQMKQHMNLIELSHVRVELDLRLFALTYVQLL